MARLLEIAFGAALIVASIYAANENLRYSRDGMTSRGTVVMVTNRVEVDPQSLSHTQSPVIEFTPAGSKTKRRFRSSIWTSAWFAPKTGETLPIVYLAAEPENARVDSWSHWLFPLLLAAVGGATLMGWTQRSERGFAFRWNSD
jgi:hypothetical protein